MSDLLYFMREALVGLWRARASTLLTVLTIGVSIFLLSGFVLLSQNLSRLGGQWKREAMVQIFLSDQAGEVERQALEADLAADPGVLSFRYRSHEEALETFSRVFGSLGDLPRTLGSNPFPASYEVTLREEDRGRASLEARLERWRAFAGVNAAEADIAWLDSLRQIGQGVQAAGAALGLLLSASALFTVVNVISLAAYVRRDEIEIMQLVGATSAWISGPFWVEGAIQGLLGGTSGLLLLQAALWGVEWARRQGPAFLSFSGTLTFLTPGATAGLLIASTLMGLAGSAFAVRRFLRTAA
ncbi:MAG: ABC transporter permease [Acidobacteriota bacterium]